MARGDFRLGAGLAGWPASGGWHGGHGASKIAASSRSGRRRPCRCRARRARCCRRSCRSGRAGGAPHRWPGGGSGGPTAGAGGMGSATTIRTCASGVLKEVTEPGIDRCFCVHAEPVWFGPQIEGHDFLAAEGRPVEDIRLRDRSAFGHRSLQVAMYQPVMFPGETLLPAAAAHFQGGVPEEPCSWRRNVDSMRRFDSG
jgi:hypothetical protein